jgi:uncharacterized surface protein with fasciclin (FAS1) repeats
MKVKTKTAALAAAVLTALTLSACGSDPAPETPVDTTTESSAETPTTPEQTQMGTIVDVATQAGSFNTLVAAIGAADLAATLSGEGPFTVFAPTDDAFAALPAGVLDALLLPKNKAVLAQILTYHVLPGMVYAADIMDGEVPTVEGSTVNLATMNGVTVNGANVVSADIGAANGLIHVIDAVILPAGVDVAALLKK